VNRVLLVLSASRVSNSCVDGALDAAGSEGAELVVLFILDTVMPRDVQERMSHEGFLGEAPSGRLNELAEVARAAERRGITHRTELVEGEFLMRALEAAQAEAPTVIFVAKRKRAALSRLVSGSRAEELKDAAACDVMIHKGGDG